MGCVAECLSICFQVALNVLLLSASYPHSAVARPSQREGRVLPNSRALRGVAAMRTIPELALLAASGPLVRPAPLGSLAHLGACFLGHLEALGAPPLLAA